MNTALNDFSRTDMMNREQSAEIRHEKWAHWPIRWSAVSVGALAAFSLVLIFGLVGIAVGAHLFGAEYRVVDVKKISMATLIFSVAGAFFSFVVGGWVAGKIGGFLHSEPSMLHGAVVWLVTVPILVVTSALGAASFYGGWYAGLGSSPGATNAALPFARPDPLSIGASADDIAAYRTERTEYLAKVKQWNEDTPKATRNSALGALTALLLGLIGSVIGGWMASGEPMNFSHHRTRKPIYH